MMDPHATPTRPTTPGYPPTWHRSWRSWARPKMRPAGLPSPMTAPDTGHGTARHRDYVTEVSHLVDDQSEILFRLVTAAATQVSTAERHIDITHEARSLTASVGTHAAVFRIEVITDRPDDLGRAKTYMVGQARCLLPSAGGPAQEWVLALQRTVAGNSGVGAVHLWMDEGARQPLTEAMVASTLRTVFA